jgi:hypothetical protein
VPKLVEGTWRTQEDGQDGEVAGTFTARLYAQDRALYNAKSLLPDGLQPLPEPEPEPEPEPQPQPQLDSRARQRLVAENAKAIIEGTPKRRPAAKTPLRQRNEPAKGGLNTSVGGTRAKSPFLRKGTGAGGAGGVAAKQYSKDTARLRSPSPTRRATPAAAALSARSTSRAGKSRASFSVRTPPAASTNGKNRPPSDRGVGGRKSSRPPRAGSVSDKQVKETAQLQLSARESQLLKPALQDGLDLDGLDRSDLI